MYGERHAWCVEAGTIDRFLAIPKFLSDSQQQRFAWPFQDVPAFFWE